MTETLRDRLIRHEGVYLKPYRDTLGNYTIGIGHLITEEQATGEYANGITEEQAMQLLDEDIAKAKAELATDMPWTLNLSPLKQDILTEMAFQLGINGLMGFKNLLFHARSGDLDGVAQDMIDSKWHSETPARCEEIANLWLNGNSTVA